MKSREGLAGGGRASLAVQFGSFVVILGIPDGLLGAIWPAMRHSLSRPLADLGQLVVASTVLYVVGGLVADRIESRLSLRFTVAGATTVGFISLAGWAISPCWWGVLAALAALGASKGVLDAALNAVAARAGALRRLGLLHASWAIGGTLGPLVVASVLSVTSWRFAVAIVAALAGLLLPFALVARHGSAPARAVDRQDDAAGGLPARRDPARRRGLAVTAVAFFAYAAAEAGPVSWGATYLVGERSMSVVAAATAMAAFWAALSLGRIALALPINIDKARYLEASCVVFVAGAALTWLLPGPLAVVGLAVAGFGSAAIFPLYVALTPERLGSEHTARAVGWAIAGAALGGPAAVYLFGLLAGRYGTAVLAPLILGATIFMYLAHRLLAVATAPGPLRAAS